MENNLSSEQEQVLEPEIVVGIDDATRERMEAAHRAALKRAKFYGEDKRQALKVKPVSEQGQAYLETMNRTQNPRPQSANDRLRTILSRIHTAPTVMYRQHELPTDHALLIAEKIYEAELSKFGKKLHWQTEDNRAIFEDVIRYFCGDPESPLPFAKSLFLYGHAGVGKSFMLKEVMYRFAQIVPIECMKFHIVSAKLLVQACADAKSLKPLDFYKRCGNLLIDDLGEEKAYVANYANTENPMDILLTARYEAYINSGHLTHFTTNSQPGPTEEELKEGKPSKLEQRYGTRNYDRICEFSEPIWIPGQSYRSEFEPNLISE